MSGWCEPTCRGPAPASREDLLKEINQCQAHGCLEDTRTVASELAVIRCVEVALTTKCIRWSSDNPDISTQAGTIVYNGDLGERLVTVVEYPMEDRVSDTASAEQAPPGSMGFDAMVADPVQGLVRIPRDLALKILQSAKQHVQNRNSGEGVCSNPKCGVAAAHLMRCTRCKKAAYCSKNCQKYHWKAGHKRICSDKTVAMEDLGPVPEPK